MPDLGTEAHPLRVAIVGAGPSGFYAAEHLLNHKGMVVEVDLFDKLPTPYGLVRYGVAPDHQKIKSVTVAYDKTAGNPRFRFFGNVEIGKDLSVEDLSAFYHLVLFTTGAQTDRRLGIPGEDLEGSYAATEFVAWYNGHPDYTQHTFDLQQTAAAVVGVGNVAVDVTRILLRTPEELAKTDIADYALEALRESKVTEVHLLGRRGPAQAAFTNPEIRELGELPAADVVVRPEEAALDELSKAELDRTHDRTDLRKVEIIQEFAARPLTGKPRRLHLRFLVSPVEILGKDGHVAGMRLVHNVLQATPAGTLSAKPTDRFEELDVGLVFRSVGYRGVALPGVPFREDWGVFLNEKGRLLDPATKEPLPGLYAAGWIKRGPTGVIGTNKPDAGETVQQMMADAAEGKTFTPKEPTAAAAETLVRERQPQVVTYQDWKRLDALEVQRGRAAGRPRIKFVRVEEMLAAAGR
ncbi:MAG TPA: FAD-dependent oxidoreductase [bacterium]|jgi:ferredoxin--NADP+ reductase|nr:FAD-dependent oxidoreductase [bacterium]